MVTTCSRRYLRARKFEVNDALKQLKDTEIWRETNKVDELYDTFDVDSFEEARKVVSSCSAHLLSHWESTAVSSSITNGLADAISLADLSTCTRSPTLRTTWLHSRSPPRSSKTRPPRPRRILYPENSACSARFTRICLNSWCPSATRSPTARTRRHPSPRRATSSISATSA